MRVLAGRLGLPPDLWSHLPPEVERPRLVEFCHSVLDSLSGNSLTLEEYLDILDRRDGIDGDNVVRPPVR